MNYFTDYDVKVIPVLGEGSAVEIDRVQSVDQTGAFNRIRVEELGNANVVGYIKQAPAVTYRAVQNEYGSLEFWRKICNKADSVTALTLADFKTPAFDIASYITDDAGTFDGTLWIPKLRVSGFSINFGDPQGLIQRNFDFVGEDWIYLQESNKYLIFKEHTVESGDIESGDTCAITLEDPAPVADPDSTFPYTYVMRVVRIRSSVATELTVETDYNDSVTTLYVDGCQVGDTIKYWYSAGSYIDGQTPFTANTTDLAGILGDSIIITLESGNVLYRLQSCVLDVRFDRQDLFELGNDEIVLRAIRNKTVTVTLGRLFDDSTIETVLRGEGSTYGKLDMRKFGDDLTIRVKIYSDSTKGTFKIGFKMAGLAPSEIGGGTSVDNYQERRNVLTGENMSISNDEAMIDL